MPMNILNAHEGHYNNSKMIKKINTNKSIFKGLENSAFEIFEITNV